MFLTCIEWFVYCNDYFIVLSNKEFTINKFHDCFLFIVELFRPTQVTFEKFDNDYCEIAKFGRML